jgi:hypothetical protein
MSLIIQDTREKSGKHLNIEHYCKSINLKIVRKTLNVGDYMLGEIKDGELRRINNITVDVKGGGLLELANDLHRDKLAFNKKYKKCYKENLKLIVLVEEKVKSTRDIVNWSSKYTKITGRYLLEMITDLRLSYGIRFMFCNRIDTGRCLIDLLTGGKNDTE